MWSTRPVFRNRQFVQSELQLLGVNCNKLQLRDVVMSHKSEIIGVCKHPSPCMRCHDVTLHHDVTS